MVHTVLNGSFAMKLEMKSQLPERAVVVPGSFTKKGFVALMDQERSSRQTTGSDAMDTAVI